MSSEPDAGGGTFPIDGSSLDLPDVGPPPPGATHFLVRIENHAGPAFPTALGDGVWVLHAENDPLFTVGQPDRGLGLEELAEDGDASVLAARLENGGVFPRLDPGRATQFVVTARPEAPRLSFATGLLESNDVILAPDGEGIPLFDTRGEPLPARDVTGLLHLFNLGTEADQAPGLGPDQAARQPEPGTGGREGLPRPFTDSTRTLPLPHDLVQVDVSESGGAFTIRVQNIAVTRRLFMTELTPLVWAVHGDAFDLFTPGEPDPGHGLEALAEDGLPDALFTWARTAPGVLQAGTTEGRIADGEAVTLTIQPDPAHPFFSLVTGLRETNDAFLGMRRLRLLDAEGNPRPIEEIELELRRLLAVWDAGTEANEVPGAGYRQGARQDRFGQGDPDPIARVRRYDDVTNDLAGVGGGGYAAVEIRHVEGTTWDVRIINRSHETANPGLISPTAWAVHDGSLTLLSPDIRITPGMEGLAEDCHAGPLADELAGTPGVLASGPLITPDGTDELRPLFGGESYSVRITADRTHRWLALITMPFPSNDALISIGTRGVELLDQEGRPRSDEAIAQDVERMWRAWDGGTEANQAGAAGHDMSPYQESFNLGEPEGDGTVRREADPIWTYPAPVELVRVVVAPLSP